MEWLAITMVVVAAIMLGHRAYRTFTGKGNSCGCGCSDACSMQKQCQDKPPAKTQE